MTIKEWFNRLFDETAGQVGARLIQRTILGEDGQPVQISVPEISGMHAFRAGLFPSLRLNDESAFGADMAAFNEWGTRLYGNAADPVIAEFVGKLVRLRTDEPWRANLLRLIITKHPEQARQQQILVFLANSNGYDDFRNRVCMLVPEKQWSTRFGEWMRENVFNSAAAKRRVKSGWQFTKRHAGRGDRFLADEVAPRIHDARISMEQELDAIIAERDRKRARRWF